MRKNHCVLLTILLLPLVSAGCNQVRYDYTNLTGKVSVDGTALTTEGSITFYPQDAGKGKGVFTPIGTDGFYKAEKVPLGKTLVKVTSTRKSGKKVIVFGQEMDEFVSALPEHYNQGGIWYDISAGQTELNIELTSKPQP
ncbi:MAG: hypothetical protein LBQ54_04950 [Planctomycetaceae bacterium]|nr:hypothetical protein [Planctomycetaceae bacterium]